MTDWHCFKCKVKMEVTDEIRVSYMDIDGNVESGLICPQCNERYLEEELVITKVLEGEQMIEDK